MSFINQLQNFLGLGNNLLQAGESALEGAENSLQNAGQQVGDAFNNCRQPNQGIFDPGFLKGILDSLRPHHQHHHHGPEHHEHHHHHHHHQGGHHHEGGRLLPLPGPINWQQPSRIEPLREGAEQGQQDVEKLERELQKLGQFPFGSING